MSHCFRFPKGTMLGIAIFSMFFGAGNVIYPIELGISHLSIASWFGFFLTAIGAPLLGLYAIVLAQGDSFRLFSVLGKRGSQFAIGWLIIALGPLGAMPRCVLLAYQAFQGAFAQAPLSLFSACLGLVLFLVALRPVQAIKTLGRYLSPALLGLIALVTVLSLKGQPIAFESGGFESGLFQGYQTMDLLASILFGASIWKVVAQEETQQSLRERRTLSASLIGAFLLAVVYFGLALASKAHTSTLGLVTPDHYMKVLAMSALGGLGARVACLILLLACLTTLIALLMTCSMHAQKISTHSNKLSPFILAILVALTMMIAHIGFDSLSHVIGTIVAWAYPVYFALVVLFIIQIKTRQRRAYDYLG